MMDLKPCPFCGNPDPDPKGGFEWVRCSVCTATADRTETWNTRPREDALQAEVDRLRTLVSGGLEAVSAAYQQALAEAQNHDRIADKHDKVVMAWKREARAALKGAPHE